MVPLLARGELKGVLCLYRFGRGNAFAEGDLQVAIRFSQLAALAIDNADIRAKLESLAMTDHLTGLFNHRFFQERLVEELSRANRDGAPVSLVIFDIDDFKNVNDRFGHLLGDQVLRGVASATGAVCRIEDPICRIGGEEFAVILPGQMGFHAQILAERVRRSVLELSFPMQTTVTVSLGVAEAPKNASSPRDLFACADLALRTAKAQGKNRVRTYTGNALKSRRGSPGDYPLSGRWEILSDGTGTSRRQPELQRWDSSLEGRESGQAPSIGLMNSLQRVSSTLNQVSDAPQIAQTIALELKSLIDFDSCLLYLLSSDGETLTPTAPVGNHPQDADVKKAPAENGLAIAGQAARSGDTIYAAEPSLPLQKAHIAAGSDAHEMLMAAPMHFDHQVIGVIVLSRLGGEFEHDDARLVDVVASIAASALQNARLLEAQREAGQTLHAAYLSTVEALANALEAQDEYTSDHARALAEMAMAVGAYLELEEAELGSLELTALFHDIGKIGVRSEIIRKPAPLSAEEWDEMKRHPEIGERILAPVPFLQAIRPMVRACHERWDGRGYPDGLSGERIPLQARIVFVCDAFHAMSTDRPYRSALPEDEAIRRITSASGSQFDPRVGQAFVRCYELGNIRLGLQHAGAGQYSTARLGSRGTGLSHNVSPGG